MPEILFMDGPHAGRRVPLSDRPMVLGRDPDVDISLNDPAVSGRHAEIRAQDGGWLIIDLDSSNGVQVGGENITTHRLTEASDVSIGDSRITFREAPVEPVQASDEDLALVDQMRERTDRIRLEVGKVIVGQREVLDQVLMCIIAGGHALLIGLPGMAKTLLVRTIASVLDLKFKRVQFTPDLMPTDIIGTDVLETNQTTGQKEFRFIPGPIFCNLLLADEINRTPPKTQAALLEAMQEKMVTAGTETYTLDEPFFVLATQNPIEQEGHLPAARGPARPLHVQHLDRLPRGRTRRRRSCGPPPPASGPNPQPVLTQEEILQLQEVVRKVPVSDHVIKYVTRLVGATRPVNDDAPEVTKKYVSTGAGPRAGQYLILAAKATAILEGRIHVSCADIRRAAPPVLRHRILTNFAADSEGLTSLDIVHKLLEEVPEPGDEAYPA